MIPDHDLSPPSHIGLLHLAEQVHDDGDDGEAGANDDRSVPPRRRDVVTEDAVPVEVTDDWYAQDEEGNVWYLGEATTEYEDGRPARREPTRAKVLEFKSYAKGVGPVLAVGVSGGSDREELVSFEAG